MSDQAPHRSRESLKFWAGQTVSLVGSEVTQLALPLLAVASLGASPGEMAVLRAVSADSWLLLVVPRAQSGQNAVQTFPPHG